MSREMKLELRHIAPYLPYGLNGKFEVNDVNPLAPTELRYKTLKSDSVDFFLKYCKPILRPLSDLTKVIEIYDGVRFIPAYQIFSGLYNNDRKLHLEFLDNVLDEVWITYSNGEMIDNDHLLTFSDWQKLFEWHFDVFGLIPSGLAIDVNTIMK